MSQYAVTFARRIERDPFSDVACPPSYVFVAGGTAVAPDGGDVQKSGELLIETLEEQGAELREIRVDGHAEVAYVFDNGPFSGVWYRQIEPLCGDEAYN